MEEPEYTRIEYSRPKAVFGALYALILLVGVTGTGTFGWLLFVGWIMNLLSN